MKNLYILSASAAIASVIVLAACSPDITYQEAMNRNERKIDNGKQDDASFLVEAKSMALLGQRLSHYASANGYAAAIVAMARKNETDFENMAEEIDDLARKERFAVPTLMNEKHQDMYGQVTRTDREDFDKDFLRELAEINELNMQRYTTMATEATDGDVRAFAARKLDVFKIHAQRIEEVEKELLNTY